MDKKKPPQDDRFVPWVKMNQAGLAEARAAAERGIGKKPKTEFVEIEEISGYSADWEYGTTLIRDSYFKEYAQDLAEEIGAIPSDAGWPNTCIDWDQATAELQMDYSSVTLAGIDYWIR